MAERVSLPFIFANSVKAHREKQWAFIVSANINKLCRHRRENNKMKKKIMTAIMTAVMVAGIFCNTINTEATETVSDSLSHDDDTIITPTERGIYATTMMVSHIDHDVITVVDTQGNEFEFLTDAPDYEINDLVACTMDNMGTATILDDILINAYYSGNITDFQEVAK